MLADLVELVMPFHCRPVSKLGVLDVVHLVLDQDFTRGRFVRRSGELLCQTFTVFWGVLVDRSGEPVTCRKCNELADRFAVSTEQTGE